MAKAVGISLSAVQGIWKAPGLVPHRVRTFELSRDPELLAKLRDIVALYLSPAAHAVVLSVDETEPQSGSARSRCSIARRRDCR
jgi:hypothetical protein